MPRRPANGGGYKIFKEKGELMGLKPMGTDSEPKQRCGPSSRMTSGLTLMPFRAPANAGCPMSTIFRVIGHALNARKGLRQFMEMDGWTEGQTGDGRMDGLFVCPSI